MLEHEKSCITSGPGCFTLTVSCFYHVNMCVFDCLSLVVPTADLWTVNIAFTGHPRFLFQHFNIWACQFLSLYALTLCMLGSFLMIFCHLLIIYKITLSDFSKLTFVESLSLLFLDFIS